MAATGDAVAPEASAEAHLWVYRQCLRWGPTPVWFGIKITVALWTLGGLVLLIDTLATEWRGQHAIAEGVLIFVNGIAIGYALGGVLRVLELARDDLLRLQPRTHFDATAMRQRADRILNRLSRTEVLVVTVGASAVWSFVNVSGYLYSEMYSYWYQRHLGTLVWSVPLFMLFWPVIWLALVLIARLARTLGVIGRHHVHVDLMAVTELAPLAQSGARLTLLIILGLTLVPLQALLLDRFDLLSALPALILLIPSAAYALVRPMWGVHRAIVEAKQKEMRRVSEALGYAPFRSLEEITSPRFDRLLRYRDQVKRVSEWPVTRTDVVGVSLYFVIPPLAWIAAALIQRLVDRLL